MSKPNTKNARVRIKRTPVLAALLTPVLLAGTWFLFTSPRLDAKSQTLEALSSLETQLTLERDRLAAVTRNGTDQAQRMLDGARFLDEQLPEKTQAAVLAARLETLATRTGAQLPAISAEPEKVPAAGGFAYVFNLEVTGNASEVVSFISGLSEFTPLTSVQAATFTPSQTGGAGALSASVTLRLWEAPFPALDQPRDGEAGASTGDSTPVDDTTPAP